MYNTNKSDNSNKEIKEILRSAFNIYRIKNFIKAISKSKCIHQSYQALCISIAFNNIEFVIQEIRCIIFPGIFHSKK